MADQYFKDTARTTDSIEATGSMASSASPPGLANKSLSSDASATAMAKFSLDLRDLEAAAVVEVLGRVPETQWPITEVSTLEMSTDSEVTFRKVLGSSEILATRPGVDPLEVTRPMADVSWTSQSPQATSPSVLIRQPTRTSPGPRPSVASHVFGPSTTQVDPNLSVRESSQTTNWHHTEDPGSLHYHCLLIRICCELPSAEPIEAEFCTVVRRRYDTIRYDAVYLTCSKKLTGSQLIVYHTFPVIFIY